VIENHGGAGGSVGTRQVAKAAPDGYTLGLGGTGTLAIDPTLYPNAGYDPRRDFAPVGLIATSPLIILVNQSIPAHNVQELIALANAATNCRQAKLGASCCSWRSKGSRPHRNGRR
jgi:tripartite-type tricarboxylate transporter receptor subunit TctC